MNIPNEIIDCEKLINEVIDISLSSISSIPPNSTLKTQIFQTIQRIEYTIQSYVSNILIEFPLLNELDKYISDEIDILIDRSKYHFSLGEINRTIKDVEFIIQNYSILLENTNNPTILIPLYKTIIGRICSVIRHKSLPINYLNRVIETFQSIPIIQDNLSTVIIMGNNTDDLLFSIVMGNDNNNNNNNDIMESNSTNNIDRNMNYGDEEYEYEEDQDIEYEDNNLNNNELNQQFIIRSYKFNENSIYKDGIDILDGINNNKSKQDDINIKKFIKPFNIATVNKFQIIETPSLKLIKESNHSIILLDMIKSMLNNIESLILFNFDFEQSIIEQIDYYLNIKPFITSSTSNNNNNKSCCFIFSNCKSSKDSLEFIELFKNKLLSQSSSQSSQSISLEIPSIYIYEQHINQIKEHIIKYKFYPSSPFKNKGITNLFNSLTMFEIQEQVNRGHQQQQSQEDIDIDILDKINKLDLN